MFTFGFWATGNLLMPGPHRRGQFTNLLLGPLLSSKFRVEADRCAGGKPICQSVEQPSFNGPKWKETVQNQNGRSIRKRSQNKQMESLKTRQPSLRIESSSRLTVGRNLGPRLRALTVSTAAPSPADIAPVAITRLFAISFSLALICLLVAFQTGC